jgi:hypothetical protein
VNYKLFPLSVFYTVVQFSYLIHNFERTVPEFFNLGTFTCLFYGIEEIYNISYTKLPLKSQVNVPSLGNSGTVLSKV